MNKEDIQVYCVVEDNYGIKIKVYDITENNSTWVNFVADKKFKLQEAQALRDYLIEEMRLWALLTIVLEGWEDEA